MYYAIHKHCVVHGCEHAFTCMANTYLMECLTVLHPVAGNGIGAWPCKTLNFSIKKKIGLLSLIFFFFLLVVGFVSKSSSAGMHHFIFI